MLRCHLKCDISIVRDSSQKIADQKTFCDEREPVLIWAFSPSIGDETVKPVACQQSAMATSW